MILFTFFNDTKTFFQYFCEKIRHESNSSCNCVDWKRKLHLSIHQNWKHWSSPSHSAVFLECSSMCSDTASHHCFCTHFSYQRFFPLKTCKNSTKIQLLQQSVKSKLCSGNFLKFTTKKEKKLVLPLHSFTWYFTQPKSSFANTYQEF